MEAVLTVRLDKEVKERGIAVMSELGYSPSAAVRALFDYAIKHDSLPFPEEKHLKEADIRERIAAFDACHTAEPLAMTDEELREARLRDRYDFDAR